MKVKIKQAALSFTMLVVLVLAFSTPRAAGWGRGHFYVIGTGPAGPHMATVQALETIKQMDVIIASEKHAKLFSGYIGDKPGLSCRQAPPFCGIGRWKIV